ncbi:MAG TPA: PEGA domain-containing protein [Candidatus Saccharimonadales bacterium]
MQPEVIRKRRLTGLIIGVSVIVFGLVIASTVNHLHQNSLLTAKVTVQATPKSATVKLNGKTVANNSTANAIKVKPGTYTISASLKGFATQSQKITVTKNQSKYVGFILQSNSKDTANWYTTHSADETLLENITGQLFTQAQNVQAQQNPILQILPHVDNQYRIDYGVSVAHPNTAGAIGIYITYYSPAGLQQALQWLKFEGYDPSKLELIETAAPPTFATD